MTKFLSNLAGSLMDGVDWAVHKLTTVVLTISIIGILLLSWSSNFYIKELMTFQINRALNAERRMSDFYNKFIRLSIKSQIHKERMYRLLNDMHVTIIELNLSIDKIYTDDNYNELHVKIVGDSANILGHIGEFRDEFVNLNAVIEDALEVVTVKEENKETDL